MTPDLEAIKARNEAPAFVSGDAVVYVSADRYTQMKADIDALLALIPPLPLAPCGTEELRWICGRSCCNDE